MKKSQQRRSKTTKQNELQGLFAELKNEYLDSFKEKIETIENYWQNKDRKNLQNEFHKIKGTGSTYGVNEATEVADLMQDLCESNSKHLGLAIMISIEALNKINHYHRNDQPLDIFKEKSYKILKHFHDELESA